MRTFVLGPDVDNWLSTFKRPQVHRWKKLHGERWASCPGCQPEIDRDARVSVIIEETVGSEDIYLSPRTHLLHEQCGSSNYVQIDAVDDISASNNLTPNIVAEAIVSNYLDRDGVGEMPTFVLDAGPAVALLTRHRRTQSLTAWERHGFTRIDEPAVKWEELAASEGLTLHGDIAGPGGGIVDLTLLAGGEILFAVPHIAVFDSFVDRLAEQREAFVYLTADINVIIDEDLEPLIAAGGRGELWIALASNVDLASP